MFSELNWKVAPRFVFGDLHHYNMTLSTILDCMEVCCCKNGQLTDGLLDVRNLGEENVWQKKPAERELLAKKTL